MSWTGRVGTAFLSNLAALGLVGAATAGASLVVPPTASGGTDVVGVLATTEAILLTGIGIALAATSAIRLPRGGAGGLTTPQVTTRSLGILATALAESATVLAARPSLSRHPLATLPVAVYGLVCLFLIVGLSKRVTDGTDPRPPHGRATRG